MSRCILRRASSILGFFLCVSVSLPSVAAVSEFEESRKKTQAGAEASATVQKKVPWRNSLFVYENALSALSMNRGADLSYNPYYAQSLSFRPRYYAMDDLSFRARLDLEIELTTSDETDHAREWIVSDLLLDTVYAPKWMKIPVVDILVSPSLRLMFPTSIVSRGRSLVMGLGPGFSLKRSFDLLKGRFLKSIGLLYAFRGTKYFNEYTTAQLNTSGVCSPTTNPDNPGCLHSGKRNVSWRLSNYLAAEVQVMEKLLFSAHVFLFNDLLYGLDGETVEIEESPSVELSESGVNHRASTWVIVDVSYDVLDWLSLSLGVSTYYPQLRSNSTYYGPFNRYTTFYFDVAVPVDAFVAQVQRWTGWGGK